VLPGWAWEVFIDDGRVAEGFQGLYDRHHGLIHKVSKLHRYQVSSSGRKAITALLSARAADIAKLTSAA
jgi:hypothetical protein